MGKYLNKKNGEESYLEIDLVDLAGQIWRRRRFVFKITLVYIMLGIIISVFSINKYRSDAKLLPEIINKEGGFSGLMKQFSGLSTLAGIDLSSFNATDALNLPLYPYIVESFPFMLQLLDTHVYISSSDTTVSLYVYMTEFKKISVFEYIRKYTFGLIGTIKEMLSEDDKETIMKSPFSEGPIRISLKMIKTIEALNKCVRSDVNQKTGIISISTELPDPEIAAQVNEKVVLYLKQYITEYRIQKVRDNLDFISDRCEEAKIDFNNAQMERANFLDENKNIISAKVESIKQRLQSQYDLTFNIYNGLSLQREQAKIKVQEETPVFKILNPVQVPIEKSRPHRSIILLGMMFLGIVSGIGIIIFQRLISRSTEN